MGAMLGSGYYYGTPINQLKPSDFKNIATQADTSNLQQAVYSSYSIDKIMVSEHKCVGISCSVCGIGPEPPRPHCATCGSFAPYGDERNLWLGYHLSWYHRLWYKIKEDPAFGIFVRIY